MFWVLSERIWEFHKKKNVQFKLNKGENNDVSSQRIKLRVLNLIDNKLYYLYIIESPTTINRNIFRVNWIFFFFFIKRWRILIVKMDD